MSDYEPKFQLNKPLKPYLNEEGRHSVTMCEGTRGYWQAYEAARLERKGLLEAEDSEEDED